MRRKCSFIFPIFNYKNAVTSITRNDWLKAIAFYPRDVVNAVLAIETWVAGWLRVLSHAAIVSKRLNLKTFSTFW